VRAEQTVAEMVVVALARQAEALSEGTDRPLEEAFAQVLRTPAGRLLGQLADGSHRDKKAADWQEGLIADRVARRKAHRPAPGAGTGESNRAKGREGAKRIMPVKDNVAIRVHFAPLLELKLAPELDVAFAQSDSLAETHALLREEEDGLDAALMSVGMPDGDGLDLMRELEEDGGGVETPLRSGKH
jgi:CheY-like chemotaxis protein